MRPFESTLTLTRSGRLTPDGLFRVMKLMGQGKDSAFSLAIVHYRSQLKIVTCMMRAEVSPLTLIIQHCTYIIPSMEQLGITIVPRSHGMVSGWTIRKIILYMTTTALRTHKVSVYIIPMPPH